MRAKIKQYKARPGGGKTTTMKSDIINTPGLHLFAAPHFLGIAEAVSDLRKAAKSGGSKLEVVEIHSKSACQNNGRCETRISDFVQKRHAGDHCCLVITHASLLTIDLTIFEGWHCHMDERPANAMMSGIIASPASWPIYQHLFRLKPIERSETHSRLMSNPEVQSRDVMADKGLSSELRNLFARGLSPCPILIEATSWDSIRAKACSWRSAWTLDALAPFKTVSIASSDLTESLCYLVHPVELNEHRIAAAPSRAKIQIRYFDTEGGTASSKFWESSEGEHNLDLISRRLKAHGIQFWTSNATAEGFLKARLGSKTFLSPCCEGLNAHRDKTSVAILLSLKAQTHETQWCDEATGLTRNMISESRESNAIYQFAQRGISREADYRGTYDIYVYDALQAERLAAKYQADGYRDVSVEHVALDGFEARVREKAGAKPKYATPEEREAARRKNNTKAQAVRRANAKAKAENTKSSVA